MAPNKEAVAIVLDVGPSMAQTPPGTASSLDTACETITKILQRKIFAESNDEVALILIGRADMATPPMVGSTYKNISIACPLGIVDFDSLQLIQNNIKPSDVSADFMDFIVVAMDHLDNELQGKKEFVSKRIILMTDLGGEFVGDQVDIIISRLKGSDTELKIIGPNLDDDADGGGGDAGGARNGGGKPKTPQQRAGEKIIKHILEMVDGQCYTFKEFLPELSYFPSRQVQPTTWKCLLEVGPDLKIPINGYFRVKDFKLKSWENVDAKNPSMKVGMSRTYHKNDDDETEVDKQDIVNGYFYGKTLVTVSDINNEADKSEKCFQVLGFTEAKNVRRHEMMGDGTMVVVAEKGDEAAAVALSSMIKALYETNMVAIVRRVYDDGFNPRVGCLIPNIKLSQHCLYWFELPFREDVRQFTFGSLPLKEENPINKKFKPSNDQLSAVDDLITNMDLSTTGRDEKDQPCEVMKPKLTFNPYFQRLYQCLQHRFLNPKDPLPDISPLIAQSLHPPQEVLTACSDSLNKVEGLFKLTVVKKKEERTGEDMFKDGDAEGEPSSKKIKMDVSLDGGMEKLAKANVTEVGSTSPVEDFITIISHKDEDTFKEACVQMQKRICQIALDSFGDLLYEKALDCVRCLREQCIKKQKAKLYNTFVKEFKDTLIAKARRDFFDKMCNAGLCLIAKSECKMVQVLMRLIISLLERSLKRKKSQRMRRMRRIC